MGIIGVGGAGNNAVDRLKLEDLREVRLAAINTDNKVLDQCLAPRKLLIGRKRTRGLGAGGDAAIGREAADADRENIRQLVADLDLVFLLSGLGGGTGSGAAPVVAELAAEAGALVIPFVTLPFAFEGTLRQQLAEEALTLLRQHSHAVIPLPNNAILQQIDESASVLDAFELADSWMARGVRAVWSMVYHTGLVNVDFATLRRAFQDTGGRTLFGFGTGRGAEAVSEAIDSLSRCPLLHLPETVKRADSLIVNVTGGPSLAMNDVQRVVTQVGELFCSRDNTVLGAVIDDDRHGEIEITILGTTHLDGPARRRTAVVGKAMTLPSAPEPPAQGKKAPPPSGTLIPLDDLPQNEFSFADDLAAAACFARSGKTLYEGLDLDVPTYLRKGVKIPHV